MSSMCAAGDFLPLLVLGGEDDFTPFIRDTFAQPAGIDVMLAASRTMMGSCRGIPC
ncbi:MAG: hypothetical protein ACLRM9_03365 [Collinsella aerofaciens]